MKNFHIAIAIPTFNRLNHLKKAINSIITQKKDKNTKISIIISNIASVDGTHEYLDDIKKTEGFYIFNQKSEVENSYMKNIYHLSQTIPNEVDWVWLMGDDDYLYSENSVNTLIDTIKNNYEKDLNFFHACQARRSKGTGKVYKDKLIKLCEKFGYHEMLGWISSLVMKSNDMKKVLSDYVNNTNFYKIEDSVLEINPNNPFSAYPHSASILKHSYNKQGIFLDTPLVEPQDKEGNPDAGLRWQVDGVLQRYLFVVDDFQKLKKLGIIRKFPKKFFRYLNYHFWDHVSAHFISETIGQASNPNRNDIFFKENLIKKNESYWNKILSYVHLLDNNHDIKHLSSIVLAGKTYCEIFIQSNFSIEISNSYLKALQSIICIPSYDFTIIES